MQFLIILVIVIIILCAFLAVSLKSKGELYETSTCYTIHSFPRKIIICDLGKRLRFDERVLSEVVQTINTQCQADIFSTDIDVIRDVRSVDGDNKKLYVFYERQNEHVNRHQHFDGPLGVLAHATVGGNQLCYDFSESWNENMFFIVSLHEICHTLGLRHTNDKTSIMEPHYKQQKQLGDGDIRDIKTLFPFLYSKH